MLNASQWHDRYVQQAYWTASLRQYLYELAGLEGARWVLDVGCGTGVLAAELARLSAGETCGVDWNGENLALAARHASPARFIQADAHYLPLPAQRFDLALCHYALLWMRDPLLVLREMRRVTREGGAVLALAEPDYGGRVDYPPELEKLGALQAEALQSQGADTEMGRKLAALFQAAGLQGIETGVLGGQWRSLPDPASLEVEWQVLESDLAGLLPPAELRSLRELDRAAWQIGERVLFVPTFYAWGRV